MRKGTGRSSNRNSRTNSRSSGKARKSKKAMILTISLAILLLLMIGAIASFYISTVSSRVKISKIDNCRLDGKYPATAVVLDITDGYSEVQAKNVLSKLLNTVESADKYTRFSLYLLQGSIANSIEPVASICNPGTVKDISYLYGNPKLVKKKWEENFRVPIQKAIDTKIKSAGDEPSLSSPIFEVIQMINSGMNNEKNITKKSIIIVSDFIQNSKNISFLKYLKPKVLLNVNNPKAVTRFFKSSNFLRFKTNLDDVDVTLHMIYREKLERIQNKNHRSFWETYFKSLNAKDIKFAVAEG